jgi:rod shape-determining protein MreD
LSSFHSSGQTPRKPPKPHVAPFVGPPWYVAAAALAVALVAQSTIVHYIAVRNVVPSLVLVAVVWYAIRVDALRAALYGLIAGLCEDALSAQTGAAWTIATGLSAIVASLSSRGFFADSIPLVLSVTLIATLVRSLVFWIVVGFAGYPPGLSTLHLHETLLQATLNVIVMTAAMLILRRFETAPQ